MPLDLDAIDHDLHDALEKLVRDHGPVGFDFLVARARKLRRDARIDGETVERALMTATLLVWLPDGRVDHLSRVIDGMVLTQRVRAPLAGRNDLWATVSLQPLLNIAAFAPIPLAGMAGTVRRAGNGQEVLLGPEGWLPAVDRYGVVGLRLEDGALHVEPVDEGTFPELEEQQRVRATLVDHYRLERWYDGTDDPKTRPGEVVRALTHARLEDPTFLDRPHPPLEELLYVALDKERDVHYWRDFAAQQNFTCSFWVNGMPEGLRMELSSRAAAYGMSFDQYVIAVLGHLAWRTPFAEDMEPWDEWDPERSSTVLRALCSDR